ncbi:MAG TPA: cobalamin biosynthesis protein CbiX [Solibacterales bacterium]|nr:cobalamin biosynthesis protein CbiX [Bryobacterales bacterium]
MPQGIIFFAHGSTVGSANEAVHAIAGQAAAQGRFPLYETAFLECAQPDLAAAVEALFARGASKILVVPYFLTLGIHLQRDLPRMVRDIEANHPGLEITVAPPLDGHPALPAILVERAKAALA